MQRTELKGQDRMVSLVDVMAVLVRRWRLVVSVPILIVLCYGGIGLAAGRRRAAAKPLVVVQAELVINGSLSPFLAMSGASLPATILGTFRSAAVLRDAVREAGIQEIAGTRLDSFQDPAALDVFIANRLAKNQSETGASLPDASRIYDWDFRATDQVFSFSLSDRIGTDQGAAFAEALIHRVNGVLRAHVSELARFYVEAVQLALRDMPRSDVADAQGTGRAAALEPLTLQEFAVAYRFLREPVDVLEPIIPTTVYAIPNSPWRPSPRNIALMAVVGLFVSSLLAFAWEYVSCVRADEEAMATLRAAAAAAKGLNRGQQSKPRRKKAHAG